MNKWILIIFLFITQGIHAVILKHGNQLLAECEVNYMELNLLCLGYIRGVYDASEGKTWIGHPYCTPDGVSDEELRKVAVKYMNDNTHSLHFSAHMLVQGAFLKAFPCE